MSAVRQLSATRNNSSLAKDPVPACSVPDAKVPRYQGFWVAPTSTRTQYGGRTHEGGIVRCRPGPRASPVWSLFVPSTRRSPSHSDLVLYIADCYSRTPRYIQPRIVYSGSACRPTQRMLECISYPRADMHERKPPTDAATSLQQGRRPHTWPTAPPSKNILSGPHTPAVRSH